MTSNPPIRLGYKASAEQFGPRSCSSSRVQAERLGFDGVAALRPLPALAPRRRSPPPAPAWLGALGGAQRARPLGTSVLTPTFRYHPAVDRAGVRDARLPVPGPRVPRRRHGRVAQRDAGRRPASGRGQGAPDRLAEAIGSSAGCGEDRVDFEGQYYTTREAPRSTTGPTSRCRSTSRRGPMAAKHAGVGDGFICTSGKGADLYRDAARRARRAPSRPAATRRRSRA